MFFHVLAVLVHAHGEEGQHHHEDAEVAAVAVAVLDDVGQAHEGDGHGQGDDEHGADGVAGGTGLDFAVNLGVFKAGDEAEGDGNACGDEAQHEADTVGHGEPSHAHRHAAGESGDGSTALYGGVVTLPAHEHHDGQTQRHGVHHEGDPHGLGAALLAGHGGAAGDKGRQRHALETCVDEGVEDGLGDILEAVGGKVGREDRAEGLGSLEDTDDVDGDGGDEDADGHIGRGLTHHIGAEDGQHHDDDTHNDDAYIIIEGEVVVQGGGGAGDSGGDSHQHHDVEEDLKEDLCFIKGVEQRFKQLFSRGDLAGVIHHHSLTHGEGQQQHGQHRRDKTGPAQSHIIGVGLVTCGEASACVGREKDGGNREGSCECDLGLLAHGRVPPRIMIGRK